MTQRMYAMDVSWPSLLRELGVKTVNVLRRAGLPDDFFVSTSPNLAPVAFFRFWEAVAAEAGDHAQPLPLRLYAAMRAESFSPAIFAALCSPDLVASVERLAKYKLLVAPQRLKLSSDAKAFTVEIIWLETNEVPPPNLVAAELLFFVSLARMGTHESVRPLRVICPTPPPDANGAYEAFLGVPIRAGKTYQVCFSLTDARRPFLSSNEAMWAVFEPELRKRLAQLEGSATTVERVRATLLEGLPGGQLAIPDVAKRLAISTRTLQRRLEEEGSSFQAILRQTRESLAMHYLRSTTFSSAEISFLLGFDEPNSFFRAFSEWTGKTPESVRRLQSVAGPLH